MVFTDDQNIDVATIGSGLFSGDDDGGLLIDRGQIRIIDSSFQSGATAKNIFS